MQDVTREVEDHYADWQEDKESFMDQLRILNQQMRLKELVISLFVPEEERSKVTCAARWSEERDLWVIDRAAAAKKLAKAAKRPVSASGLRRPTTDFTKSVNAAGDLNPRFRSENILSLELDMPERTTFDYDDLVGTGSLQEALNMVYPEEQDVMLVGAEGVDGMYLDPGPKRRDAAEGEIKAHRAPRPSTGGPARPASARRRT